MTSDRKFEQLKRVVDGVSRETFDRLLLLEQFFLKWARRINLVAPSTLEQAWTRHVLDSAQLWTWRDETRAWLDLGSGSGFPGLVLAIFSHDHQLPTTLVESNGKKAAYLRQASTTLGLNVKVLTQRVEELDSHYFSQSDCTITARAFAPLSRLLEWTNGLGGPATRALLHKGRGFQVEVLEARGSWAFDLIERPSLVDSDSVILDITAVKRL